MRWNLTLRVTALMWLITFCGIGLAAKRHLFRVSVDTSPLVDHPAGPFSLLLVMTDGTGIADGKATATITRVELGGGKPLGQPFLAGGATGDLSNTVIISNSSSVSVFEETFLAGERLSFHVSFEPERTETGLPTGLALYILDGRGNPIATTSPASDFLSFDLTFDDLDFSVYASNPSQSPFAGGVIDIPAPKRAITESGV